MIYKGTNLVKAIYKGDQFLLAVYKGQSRIFPQIGGADHVGSYTAFNINSMTSYSGRYFNGGGEWYYPVFASAMPDKVLGGGANFTMCNPTGLPVSFTKSAAFNCRIHRCFRIYTPFAVTLATGKTRGSFNNPAIGNCTTQVDLVNLSIGYNYVSQVVDFSVTNSEPYLFPLVFGQWSSNWIVDHISVQVVPI